MDRNVTLSKQKDIIDQISARKLLNTAPVFTKDKYRKISDSIFPPGTTQQVIISKNSAYPKQPLACQTSFKFVKSSVEDYNTNP